MAEARNSTPDSVTPVNDEPVNHHINGVPMSTQFVEVQGKIPSQLFKAPGFRQRGAIVAPGPETENGKTIEITVQGHENAKERLSQEVGRVATLLGGMDNPAAYLEAYYGQTTAHASAARPQPTLKDRQKPKKMTYDEIAQNPDEYFRGIGQGLKINVDMRTDEQIAADAQKAAQRQSEANKQKRALLPFIRRARQRRAN